MTDDLDIEIAAEKNRPEQPTACVFEVVAPDQIGAALAIMLPKVGGWLAQGHGEAMGPPFARYHAGPDGKLDIEAGVAVVAPVVGDDQVRAGTLPGGRCAVAQFRGPYDHLPRAHQRLQEWMAGAGETGAGDPWEVYVTDPMSEPDSSQWLTLIYHPLAERA